MENRNPHHNPRDYQPQTFIPMELQDESCIYHNEIAAQYNATYYNPYNQASQAGRRYVHATSLRGPSQWDQVAAQHNAAYYNFYNHASQTDRCYLGPSGSATSMQYPSPWASSQRLQFDQRSLSSNLGSGIQSTFHSGIEQTARSYGNIVDNRVTRLLPGNQGRLVHSTDDHRQNSFQPFSLFMHEFRPATSSSGLGSIFRSSDHSRILDGPAPSSKQYNLWGGPDELLHHAQLKISEFRGNTYETSHVGADTFGGDASGNTISYGYASASHGTVPSSSGARQTSLQHNAELPSYQGLDNTLLDTQHDAQVPRTGIHNDPRYKPCALCDNPVFLPGTIGRPGGAPEISFFSCGHVSHFRCLEVAKKKTAGLMPLCKHCSEIT